MHRTEATSISYSLWTRRVYESLQNSKGEKAESKTVC